MPSQKIKNNTLKKRKEHSLCAYCCNACSILLAVAHSACIGLGAYFLESNRGKLGALFFIFALASLIFALVLASCGTTKNDEITAEMQSQQSLF